MADAGTEELIKSSVTSGDVMKYMGEGLVNFILPYFWFNAAQAGALPLDLPGYWSLQRDAILRQTIAHESFWAGAISIASTKAAAQSVRLNGPSRLVRRSQEIMLQWGGAMLGFVPSQEMGVTDYLTTGNGEFHEIVRASNASGSRILGLIHLDSLRCTRTGDPEIPVLYRDLQGGLHEMKYWQVIMLADQPDPGAAWFGVGHCAAERAYKHIFRLASIEQFINEKITGAGAHKMTFIKGISTEQIRGLLNTSDADRATKGFVYYQGAILAGILGDLPLEMKEVILRGLPDGFDRKQELDIGLLAYANAIGLDPQDLQPLTGQGLGAGAQSRVLFEKSKGRGLAARSKQLLHLLNQWVLPDRVTFAWNERDLADEMKRAEISASNVATRAQQIQSGEITTEMARHMGADAGDIPRDFVPGDLIPTELLDDETKPPALDAAAPRLTEDLPTTPIPQPGQEIAPARGSGQESMPVSPAVAQMQQTKALLEVGKTLRQAVVEARRGRFQVTK